MIKRKIFVASVFAQPLFFGVNASAVPSFVFKGEKRGTKIEILYGERLNDDGTVNVLTQTAGQIKSRWRFRRQGGADFLGACGAGADGWASSSL